MGGRFMQENDGSVISSVPSADLVRLVEATPDVLFQITTDCRWAFLNTSWTTLLGHPHHQSIGRPVTDFAVAEDRPPLAAMISEVIRRGGPPRLMQVRWRKADGGVRTMELRLQRLSDLKGPPGAIGSLRDIGTAIVDAQALSETQALNTAILDTAKAPIIVLNEAGHIMRFNPACEHLSGYREAEVIGRDIYDMLIPPEDRAGVETALNQVLTDGAAQHENRWLHRDGTVRHLLWRNAILETPAGRRIVAIGTNITRLRAIETALRDSKRRLREIADLLTEGVYVVDEEGRCTFLNPSASAMLGWTAEEAIGLDTHSAWHHSRPDGTAYAVEECPVRHCLTDGIVVRRHEDWFITREGRWLPVAVTAAPIIRDGMVTGAVTAFHDISDRLSVLDRLRESETRYRTLFDGSSDAIFVIALDDQKRPGRILQVNETATRRLGYSRNELCRKTILEVTTPESVWNPDEVIHILRASETATFERVQITKGGVHIPVEVNASLVDYDGQKVILAVARDITERKEAETRIRYLADYDQLTGLPNRTQFTRRCEQELNRAQRHDHQMAILFLDLDGFKAVNDTHGHAIGDELLKVVAQRLTASLRSSDIAARQGGDEFVILLPEISGSRTAERVADKLIETVNQPIDLNGHALHVGVSIGLALYPHHGTTVDTLQRHADTAMYTAKHAGRNQWAAFAPDMEPAA